MRMHKAKLLTLSAAIVLTGVATAHATLRRDEGYAPEENDWFWAKYMPDGEIAATPGGKDMASRVTPCISCHQPADGEDFVWSHDRFAH